MSVNQKKREKQLRRLLGDPVKRLIVEREYFEATKQLPPAGDDDLLRAVLELEFGAEADRS